ncbi:MAG: cytochrome c maturation protein CcmE [Alphaproteobacteria bacterium]|nr:cytochrome c maturation protein CcmE [Alphaproteobacteria bacterium]
MNAKKKRRLAFAAALVAVGAMLAVLIRYGLGQNIMYFHSPADVAAGAVGEGVAFRLGGLVEKGSVSHGAGAEVHFKVTDGKGSVPADFVGVLPALFREGQGVVATGAMDAHGTFVASEVLAKHDEKYMPPEVVAALKKSGRWKEGDQ